MVGDENDDIEDRLSCKRVNPVSVKKIFDEICFATTATTNNNQS